MGKTPLSIWNALYGALMTQGVGGAGGSMTSDPGGAIESREAIAALYLGPPKPALIQRYTPQPTNQNPAHNIGNSNEPFSWRN